MRPGDLIVAGHEPKDHDQERRGFQELFAPIGAEGPERFQPFGRKAVLVVFLLLGLGGKTNFPFLDGVGNHDEAPGLLLGAVPATVIARSISSRASGSGEKCRTLRRRLITASNSALAASWTDSGSRFQSSGTKRGGVAAMPLFWQAETVKRRAGPDIKAVVAKCRRGENVFVEIVHLEDFPLALGLEHGKLASLTDHKDLAIGGDR